MTENAHQLLETWAAQAASDGTDIVLSGVGAEHLVAEFRRLRADLARLRAAALVCSEDRWHLRYDSGGERHDTPNDEDLDALINVLSE